ncbi:hypothetical protein QQS21_010863 [Conoideocrella luteorostrata]|uniref:Uncharacterized protein n=1 Tax=Conoideocrella luteorostrata TaxID=1105319 RepID=A0AAJ0CGZ0_9HYPO|nr:hypothetical protein QQS21_010863 [Conoideocrella luteorostrata]
MSDDGGVGLVALGALLGYVGAEVAPTSPFEHLLWPNRHLSHLSLSSALAIAILMPMGGPIHKAALEIFDKLYAHGLFLGRQRGHMLGTAFFNDIGWTYTLHGPGHEGLTKKTRNCLWALALGLLPVPEFDSNSNNRRSRNRREEKGLARKSTIRARTCVHHLTFSPATIEDKNSNLPFVKEHTKMPNISVHLTIMLGESTAIIIAVVLIAVWRTPWAALWLAPLALRLLSAVFTLHREPLVSSTEEIATEKHQDFQINCPPSIGNFMIFTGPPTIVLQFMRHYGHPVRHRPREVLQLVIIIILASIFPVGLITSTLSMPRNLQYVWFGYQIYLVAALHFARYSPFIKNISTQAAIADALDRRGSGDLSRGQSILFGQKRHGSGTIRVELVVTYHERYQDGQKAMEKLLSRHVEMKSETADDKSSLHRESCSKRALEGVEAVDHSALQA